ncbi:MAG: hypothetical protein JO215_08475 [Ktedonobacteraceae bacterium]|nr:hypothetical protein [Ktedonobacteraceae bacterium]MBV9711128.1 hypothetical protein [Ktedonobacteraceae bacterium]
MTDIPSDQHITYQLQYRKCGKASCSTCRNGQGHGPYWYAYWREGSRLRSGYVGKVHPNLQGGTTPPAHPDSALPGSSLPAQTDHQQTTGILREEFATTSALL